MSVSKLVSESVGVGVFVAVTHPLAAACLGRYFIFINSNTDISKCLANLTK